ncbi:cytochrome P450 26C1 [Latimeria chalumnae]|uniref:cytochrome P450 26C1 n=1 Tax=Latimeria chalumnae TaxID=7897 RepID=UPI0006D93A6F|nr:PREDICTED: cytochrome P450 26C1 [Latimeria chalumnae]|eukprot:XP_014341348.1 PREDICTED: cytochrome P450 26C1 [Latimeria chalumnae]
MFLLEFSYLSIVDTIITSIMSSLLLLAVSRQLWTLRWNLTRDRGSKLPLPKGSMGWPLFGETMHWLVQGSNFHVCRRKKYGNVFKTHLLGKPVIRVTGAENIRRILLGEHSLVSTQWPQSTRLILGPNTLVNSNGELHRQRRKILAKVFSHTALEIFLPRIQELVRGEIQGWCREQAAIAVYPVTKALTFRIAVRILLGLSIDDRQLQNLAKTFEQLIDNLFSLPLDIPFCGLRKGMKARDTLHEYMEKAITEKLQKKHSEGYHDALDFMMSSAKELGVELSMQELKESAVELIFAAFSTTASASTSLILQLLKHPFAVEKVRRELVSHGINLNCHCLQSSISNNSNKLDKSSQQAVIIAEAVTEDSDYQQPLVTQFTMLQKDCQKPLTIQERNETIDKHFQRSILFKNHGTVDFNCKISKVAQHEITSDESCPQSVITQNKMSHSCNSADFTNNLVKITNVCECQPHLNLDKLSRLCYLGCVVKEVLRLLPPISGGYRTVLQTFELEGYQIPKGWSVMYSIRDTHETSSVYQNPDLFDPDRFGSERNEGKSGRFNYVPFGGGIRGCIGKELAQVILKILAIELVSVARWELATVSFPKMQSVPILHPVDGLQLYFHSLHATTIEKNITETCNL